jgi:LysR family transcriptional regulator, regulator for genes of the gallate degradation pathway
MDFNLRHLAGVAAIARAGSISAAAPRVNLTQPALTQGLARIEAQLGLVLFERHASGMSPTDAAKMLVPRIEAVLAHVASPRVTAAQVRAFAALARTGSYRGASRETGLAEPSLHRAVGDLSVALRRTLVERRGRGIALTEAGLRTARGFGLAIAELAAACDELAVLSGREIGRITIGAMPLSRARVLPAAVAVFHRRHPEFDIRIVEGSHAELLDPLRDGSIDVTIGALRGHDTGPDLVERALFEDRPTIVGRAAHPLAARSPDVSELSGFSWIISAPGTPLRTLWETLFHGAPPRVPVECGSVITIREILRASDFLTLLSPDQVAAELAAGWLTTIGTPPAHLVRTIGLTMRHGWRPTALQSAFIDTIEGVTHDPD